MVEGGTDYICAYKHENNSKITTTKNKECYIVKNDENKDGQPKNDSKPNLSSKETLTKIKGLIIKVIKIAKHKFKDAGGVKGIKSNVLKFIDTIKTGFVSDTGVTGFKGVLSRIKNLWNNGNEGKAFILGTAIVLILIYGNKDTSNTSIADLDMYTIVKDGKAIGGGESTHAVTPRAPLAKAARKFPLPGVGGTAEMPFKVDTKNRERLACNYFGLELEKSYNVGRYDGTMSTNMISENIIFCVLIYKIPTPSAYEEQKFFSVQGNIATGVWEATPER